VMELGLGFSVPCLSRSSASAPIIIFLSFLPNRSSL
jgi:hypothetical protein